MLNVSGNRLSVAGLDALAAGVAACSSLCSLSLNNTQARVIPASMLQLLSRLDELTVHDNALLFPPDEVVATGTACVMEYLSSAQELNLSGSDVQGDDVKWIVEALPMMPHLAALAISKTKIGCEGLKALASDAVSQLVSLNISGTDSDGSVRTLLSSRFFDNFSSLMHLAMTHLPLPFKCIASLSNLTSLNIDYCSTNWPSSIDGIFGEFASLRFFSAKGVKLSFCQLDEIARNLAKHQTIRQFIISDIQAQHLPASCFEIMFLLLEQRQQTLHFSLTNVPCQSCNTRAGNALL